MTLDTDKTVVPEDLARALIDQFHGSGLFSENIRIDSDERVVLDMTARTSINKVADQTGRVLAEARLRGWVPTDILWDQKKVVLRPVD